MRTVYISYDTSIGSSTSSSSSTTIPPFVASSSSSSRSSSSSSRSSSSSSRSSSSSSRSSSSSSRSSSSSIADAGSSGIGGGAGAPCGGGHACNRATFDIAVGYGSSLTSNISAGPGDVVVLRAELNNAGAGNGGPDNGPGAAPFDGTMDRYSSAVISAETSAQIFGADDHNGQTKGYTVKIIPIPENTNPHTGITWVRIKNTCGQIVYSCCLSLGGGNTQPPGGGNNSYGAAGSTSILRILNYSTNPNDPKWLSLISSKLVDNDLNTYPTFNIKNINKFKFNEIYYSNEKGKAIGDVRDFGKGFVSLITASQFLDLCIKRPNQSKTDEKFFKVFESNCPIVMPSIQVIQFKNGDFHLLHSRGKATVHAIKSKYGHDHLIPVFIGLQNFDNLTDMKEIVNNLNRGLVGEDGLSRSKDVFSSNYYE